jgi:hypothetical protein
MSDWYDASGVPGLGAPGASTVIKGEFAAIGNAFALMPPLGTHGSEYVRINAGGTALESVTLAGLQADLDLATEILAGVIELATLAEVNAGTNHTKAVTPYTFQESTPGVTTDASAARTLTNADKDDLILFTNPSGCTVTLPSNTTEALPLGWMCHLHQDDAGTVTVSNEVGVTVNYSETPTTRAQNSSLTVIKTATNTWLIIGDQAFA